VHSLQDGVDELERLAHTQAQVITVQGGEKRRLDLMREQGRMILKCLGPPSKPGSLFRETLSGGARAPRRGGGWEILHAAMPIE